MGFAEKPVSVGQALGIMPVEIPSAKKLISSVSIIRVKTKAVSFAAVIGCFLSAVWL
jgi:hypothetical protein